MTAITLELPDDLAMRLERARPLLPQLLRRILGLEAGEPADPRPGAPVYFELLDFLAHRPTPDEILAYKASAPVQERMEDLLERNRESVLSPQEAAELDTFQQVNHLLVLLKARARAGQQAP